MINFSNIRMKPKLIGLFLLVGLLPLGFLGWLSSDLARQALMASSFAQLESVREIKKNQILKYMRERQEDLEVLGETVSTLRQGAFGKLIAVNQLKHKQMQEYFARKKGDIEMLASNKELADIYARLKKYHDSSQAGAAVPFNISSQEYQDLWQGASDFFLNLIMAYDYFDIDLYLVEADSGTVLYSAAQEDDLGTDLANGPYRQSGLARLWQKVVASGATAFVDFSPYAPMRNEPTAFIGSPLLDDDGRTYAMVAMQLSIEEINDIMLARAGMGETGESYLVGPDYLMRSDSFIDPLHHSIHASFADPARGSRNTSAVRAALAGQTGYDVMQSYANSLTLTAYVPFYQKGLAWALVSEKNVTEAFCPIDHDGKYFFAKYIEKYGYEDFFLINPDGHCYYSVGQGSDYQTNLLTGPFAESNLGRLVSRVLETGEFGMTDFSLYIPSNNQPMAFMAWPLVHDGHIEVVIALQLSPEGINDIMHKRQGMGKSGETYLVGSDKRMRSDSILDPESHSVLASFNGTVAENGVDTTAARQALAGLTDTEVIVDYTGKQVLAAYTPVEFGNFQWALLAEIDLDQVMEPVNKLHVNVLLIALVFAALVALVAYFIAKGIALPLGRVVDFANGLAQGEIGRQIDITSRDELGEMARALNRIPVVLGKMIGEIEMSTLDIVAGRLRRRAEAEGLQGSFADLLRVINHQADALINHIDKLPNPMLLMDQDLTILYANKAAAILCRLPFSEVVGCKCYDLLNSADCQTENCACRLALDSGQRVQADTIALPADSRLEISYTGNPIRDENGEIVAVLEVIVDQTAIKEAQRQIIKVADYQKDEAGKLTRALKDISSGNLSSGYMAEPGDEDTSKAARVFQDIQLGLDKMMTTLQEAATVNERNNWLKTGQNELAEVMRSTQDVRELSRKIIVFVAELLQAQVGAFYLSDDKEDLTLAGTYAFTRRKSLLTTIRPGQGLVGEAALEKGPIIISDIPEDYIRIDSSLGHTPPRHILVFPILMQKRVMGVIELGSLTPFTDLHLEFLQQTAEAMAIAIHATHASQQTKELLDKTQQQAEELQSQQEELQASNEELREQTESLQKSESLLQQQQEELQVTNEELAERTHNLERQQEEVKKKNEELARHRNELMQKATELETTSKYKSEFLANMSHELRTPLNSILILSQLFAANKDANLTEKQMEYARTINSSGTELLNLINEVLDLSKVEAGRMQLDIAPLNLQQFLTEMEQAFAPVAADKGLKLDFTIDDDVPAVISTDHQKLLQVIKNFISNAFKFTEKGRVGVHISRPAADMDLGALPAGKTIAINVIDTGIGIAQDKQKIIFEAFQQVDGTISRKYGGTGLGLSISREFTSLLGGEIRLTSQVGHGSTFTMLLPENTHQQEKVVVVAKEAAKGVPEIEVKKEDSRQHPPAKTGNGDVIDDRKDLGPDDNVLLIIEDDQAFVKVLVDFAHERQFKCLVAEDGESGIHYADFYQPSAIILDIGLPGIDGWQVMDRLKKNSKTSHIPVHFMSAADQAMEARQKGAIGYLTKPVSVEKIQEALGLIEENICSTVKNLLIVEDHGDQRNSMVELISSPHIDITAVATGKEALQLLKEKSFDCMVLDLGLQDMSGGDLLQKMNEDKTISPLPIIIYTGRELSQEDEEQLRHYSDSIIIKGVRSPERLLAETTLFLHQVEAELPEEKQMMLAAAHNREEIFENKKVLVVDDDMRNVFALSSALEEKGMEVLAAENGRKGLEMLDANPDVAVVLMDIMMPEMDGFEAMGHIRSQPRFRKLPVIALTAKAMKGDRHKCIEAGANDYLAKPVAVDRLLSLLRVWLCQ